MNSSRKSSGGSKTPVPYSSILQRPQQTSLNHVRQVKKTYRLKLPLFALTCFNGLLGPAKRPNDNVTSVIDDPLFAIFGLAKILQCLGVVCALFSRSSLVF